MALQFRRGTEAEKNASTFVPAEGEPIYLTDVNKIFIGDGSTVGGIEFVGASSFSSLPEVTLSTEIDLPISYYSVSSNVVSITIVGSHDYEVGDSIVISDSSVSILNGTHTITNVPGVFGFDFALVTANVANTATNGNVHRSIRDGEVLTYNTTGDYWTNTAPVTALSLLEDVNVEGLTLANGQALTYSSTLSAWTAQTLSTSQIGDFAITSVSNGQVLQYNTASGKWVNVTLPHVDTLLGLTDVSNTSPTNNQVLRYNSTASEWQSVTLNLNSLSNVGTAAPNDGDSLVYNSATSLWTPQSGVSFLTNNQRFYSNVVNENNETNIERYVLRFNNYLDQAEQISVVPDFDPSLSWWDRYQGTVKTPSYFGRWTRSTAGTGTRANGYYFVNNSVINQKGDIWSRSLATASPLANVAGQKIWFEIDIKWEDNAIRSSYDVEIFSIIGQLDASTTNHELFTLWDNYAQQSADKGKLSVEGYDWYGDEAPTGLAGDIWYRVCGVITFDGSTNSISVWVGERDTATELEQVILATPEDLSTFDTLDPSRVDIRQIRILSSETENYYIDNFYVGFGENRYGWQAAEDIIEMDRTYGSTPKKGALTESNTNKIKSVELYTDILADGESEDFNEFIGQSGFLRKVTVDHPCRVRGYVTSAARTSDAARSYATTPGRYIGLIFDHEFASAGSINMTPCPIYSISNITTEESLRTYFTVENQSGSDAEIIATIEYTELEYSLFE